MVNSDFTLEFCARERSLPYAKMIHNRMLISALDHNLEHVSVKACFLLAEATIWMLKNIIAKLASRSRFKHKLRQESAYVKYQQDHFTDQDLILQAQQANKRRGGIFGANRVVIDSDILSQFELEPEFIKELMHVDAEEANSYGDPNSEWSSVGQFKGPGQLDEVHSLNNDEQAELKELGDKMLNPAIVPIKRLPATLFDLKTILQVSNHTKSFPLHQIQLKPPFLFVAAEKQERAESNTISFDLHNQHGEADLQSVASK